MRRLVLKVTASLGVLASAVSTMALAGGNEELLETAIREQKVYVQSFEAAAKGVELPHISTMFNETGLAQYQCAALALLLGKKNDLRSGFRGWGYTRPALENRGGAARAGVQFSGIRQLDSRC